MDTYSVTYFKNHALRILSQVAVTGEKLVVTKHGRPLAQIGPVPKPGKLTIGKLKGAMEIHGDIVAPLGDGDWDACR